MLCPGFFVEDGGNNPPWKLRAPFLDAIEKEYNIKAVEEYAVALCNQLATQARLQYDKKYKTVNKVVSSSSSVLQDYVKLNLEKIAAKSFNPSFLQKNNQTKSFASFVEQTKKRTDKYSGFHKDPIIFADQQAKNRAQQKTDQKKDQDKYKERVQARLSVYKGWQFMERKDGQEGFILRHDTAESSNSIQEITVTKNAKSSFDIISTGNTVNDETIAIMLELSHNVIRFSDTKMTMTIQGAESKDLSDKITEGLAILNNNKDEQEKINYTFDKKQDNK